jgi:hypothetical protein
MSILLLALIVASLLVLFCVLPLLKYKKDLIEKKEINRNDIHEEQICKKIETCWCSEYNLGEEKKEKVLKEFGDHNCGKSVSSIIGNLNDAEPSIPDQNGHPPLIKK